MHRRRDQCRSYLKDKIFPEKYKNTSGRKASCIMYAAGVVQSARARARAISKRDLLSPG